MRLSLLVAGALCLALTGCGGEELPRGPIVNDPGSAPAVRPSASAAGPRAPLAGIEATAAVAGRQATAVLVRVGAGSPAPAGLDAADLLFQEYAESGSYRFAAIYHSRDAAQVGPVAELRPADLKTLAVFRPFIGYGSAPENFANQLADSTLPAVAATQRGDLFPGGYTSTGPLLGAAPAGGTPPPGTFLYAEAGTPLAQQGLAPARQLTVTPPGGAAQTWQYDDASGTWRGVLSGVTVSVSSVVVLTMPYKTVEVRHPSRREMPSAQVYGEGAAWAVSGPSGAPGRWSKPGQKQLCNVVDASGYQMRLRPGTTWVVYAPDGSAVTVA